MSFVIPKTSPAFILDKQAIQKSAEQLSLLREQSGCRVLYSVKALPFKPLLHWLQPFVDGFSVSSLFEAKLAAEVLDKTQSIHLTTPGIRPDEVTELNQLCSHISFNSLSQAARFGVEEEGAIFHGLRINPQLSFLSDDRFNPCRLHSKLGVPLETLQISELAGIKGLQIHTVFSQENFYPLIQTLDKLEQYLGQAFYQLEWLNLGGGYLFQTIKDCQPFIDLVKRLQDRYGIDIYIEPGKDIVGHSMSLSATVIDCFSSDGKTIAVLDTSVNHNPEVFEFQRQPEIIESNSLGQYSAILAGSTCLAGDIFGEYALQNPIKIGDRITFINVGAYTLVKANRFNGYNFPDIYSLEQGVLMRLKHYDYNNYRIQWE